MLDLAHRTSDPRASERPDPGEAPHAYVERLALAKAQSARLRQSDVKGALVISGDTVVSHRGEILEKPTDRTDARRMLRRLSGRTHRVYTGHALRWRGRTCSGWVRSDVSFRELTDQAIQQYAETGEPLDKAGGYGIQGMGSALVREVSGDFFAVVGFSVRLFLRLLREHGLAYRFGSVEEAP